ncbi:MAG: hypothetical protein ACFFEE_05380 [Candidatus Thorarchaeota archaeon]
MKSRKRFIPLVIIILYGISYAFLFSTSFVSSILDAANPLWDILPFIPGLADVDNLYLTFVTFIWSFVALLLSAGVAGFFMLLHRTLEKPRTLRIETIEPELSISRLIRRAIIPAMFSFSIGETAVLYLRQYATGFFQSPGLTGIPIADRLSLFVTKTFHLTFLFLPLTLLIFIPTWILNDHAVVSHRKGVLPREYTDPQKVGRWVSGLLSGFSIFAFPLAFLDVFLITPIEGHGWGVVAEILPTILLIMGNVLIVLIAYILPIIVLYELRKSRIASLFHIFAKRLDVENRSILLSLPDDSSEPMVKDEG